jgi:4-hydroxyphenylpyruvate dioxygenase-like putative hemolysin
MPAAAAAVFHTRGAGNYNIRSLPTGGIMVRGIDHIELIVRNVDETITFFQDLGFKLLTRTKHHGTSVEMQLPGENQPIFEIHQVTGEENPGVNHIAFKVDNAKEAYAQLQGKVKVMREPNYVQSTGRTTVHRPHDRQSARSRRLAAAARRREPSGAADMSIESILTE